MATTEQRAPKRERVRLARAELLLKLAVTAERWHRELAELPVETWPDDDPFVALMRTYGLSKADLARICDRIGTEIEGRALRAGYDDHWDDPNDD